MGDYVDGYFEVSARGVLFNETGPINDIAWGAMKSGTVLPGVILNECDEIQNRLSPKLMWLETLNIPAVRQEPEPPWPNG